MTHYCPFCGTRISAFEEPIPKGREQTEFAHCGRIIYIESIEIRNSRRMKNKI